MTEDELAELVALRMEFGPIESVIATYHWQPLEEYLHACTCRAINPEYEPQYELKYTLAPRERYYYLEALRRIDDRGGKS